MGASISIHALLAESDGGSVAGNWRPAIFLSTLSLRRATLLRVLLICQPLDFYPRSPCGERLGKIATRGSKKIFLSTLSLRRATLLNRRLGAIHNAFLSTLSLRRATEQAPYRVWETQISIHALLAESDACTMTIIIYTASFLSTLSLRRATLVNSF